MRAVVLFGATAVAVEASNSVIGKTISLLKDMVSQNKKDMDEEAVQWASRSTWCKGTQQSLDEELKALVEEKESQEGIKGNAEGQVASLTDAISEKQGEIADAQSRLDSISATRKEEKAAYVKEKMDLDESVMALEKAVTVIAAHQKSHGKIAQSFLQTSNEIPEKVRSLALSLMETNQPEKAAYEAQTGGVMDLLDDTLEQFKTKQYECERAEINAKNNFLQEKQSLVDTMANGQDALEALQVRKGEQQEVAATAGQKLAELKADYKATGKEMQQTTIMCKQEKSSFSEKQGLRGDEIQALEQAIEILDSRVAGKMGAFAQQPAATATSLLQIGTTKDVSSDERRDAARVSLFLSKRSTRLNSKVLSLLATKLAEDPFVKVRKMIEEMVSKLQQEAKEEQSTHIFCKNGLDKAKRALKKHTLASDKHRGAMAKATALATELMESSQQKSDMVASFTKELVAKEKDRNESNALYKKQYAEAKDVEAALTEAIAVLRDFYAKASGATAFVQVRKSEAKAEEKVQGDNLKVGTAAWDRLGDPEAPAQVAYGAGDGEEDSGHTEGQATFGASYNGQQDTASAIIDMLDVALQTASQELVKLQTAESADASNFAKYKQATTVSIATLETEANNEKTESLGKKTAASASKEQLELSEKMYRAAKKEHDALLPMCPANLGGTKDVVTHEERLAQRQEEIDSLKEALTILSEQ